MPRARVPTGSQVACLSRDPAVRAEAEHDPLNYPFVTARQALPQDYVARLWACESLNDPRQTARESARQNRSFAGRPRLDWYRQTVDELSVRA